MPKKNFGDIKTHVTPQNVKFAEDKRSDKIPPMSGSVHPDTSKLSGARMIPFRKVKPDPKQPRTNFREEPLKELAASISEHGILQPLVVQYIQDGDYFQIVSGERRYRASELIGLKKLPCIIRDNLTQGKIVAQQLIENIHREDLSPIEKARGFYSLKAVLGDVKWKDVEKITGVSERRRQQFIALLELPKEIQKNIVNIGSKPSQNQVTEGHARALLRLDGHPEKQQKLFNQILKTNEPITSRQAMHIAREMLGENTQRTSKIEFSYSSLSDLITQLKAKIDELEILAENH